MNLQISRYDHEYYVASFAKTKETCDKMLSDGYNVAWLDDDRLLFPKEDWVVLLDADEYAEIEMIGEYSILEFYDKKASLYFDVTSDDNALFITNRCNSGCVMCPISDKSRELSSIMDLDALMIICNQIPSDTKHITITGGEPFLIKKNMFLILDCLRERLPCTSFLLLTNGRVFSDAEYATSLKNSIPEDFLVAIPVHGSSAEKHDYITRVAGSFEQTRKGLHNLLNLGMRIELRIVVSKLNIYDIQGIVDFICRELKGVSIVNFIGMEMLGNARLNFDEVWIGYKETFDYLCDAIYTLIKSGFDVGLYNYPLCCVPKEFWAMCAHSISPSKVRFLPKCDQCKERDACGGMFFGTMKHLASEIEAII